VDGPIAGLLGTWRRGLLDGVIVVWGTRRRGGGRATGGTITRRVLRLAGRGHQGGVVHGKADEISYGVEDRHFVTDIHATVLHQLGLRHAPRVPGRRRLDIDRGQPSANPRVTSGPVKPGAPDDSGT
jgi:hypothetical protein